MADGIADERAECVARMIAIARAEVGVMEEGGNNRGTRIRHYQAATSLPPGPWPWCAAFTSWVLCKALQDERTRRYLGLVDEAAAQSWRCKQANVFESNWAGRKIPGWNEWALMRRLVVLGEEATCKPGDFVTFDFSHIGLVVQGGRPGVLLETIEGNTGAAGLRDSNSGDGVCTKTRRHTPEIIRSFIRVF